MHRRTLLKALGAAGAYSLASKVPAAVPRRLGRIGLQMYTLRQELAGDFTGTLRRAAELGYGEIEFAGYFDHSPATVRRVLDELELDSPAAHIPLSMVEENLSEVIETSLTIGHEYVVVPFVPPNQRTLDDYRALADTLNRAGETCRNAGLTIGYHNHDFEFVTEEGRRPYDLLLERTDPDLVAMELDLFWIRYAGADPVTYFAEHPGRFAMLHVKDMSADREMVDVGTGEIDFARIFRSCDIAGCRHFFVEHDRPADGFASVAVSARNLQALVY